MDEQSEWPGKDSVEASSETKYGICSRSVVDKRA